MTRPTVEDIRRDEMFPAYVACMRKILGELADWSVERVDADIEHSLHNPGFRCFFMHDTPSYDAAWSLIPERLRERVGGGALVDLHHRIWHTSEGVSYQSPLSGWSVTLVRTCRGRYYGIDIEHGRPSLHLVFGMKRRANDWRSSFEGGTSKP